MKKKKFDHSWRSLKQYRCPDWFRDAKFGIWAHWGPQCVPMCGDWYARHMYCQGYPQYEHHVRIYGHPSKFGFKDIISLWKGEKFDPEYLISLYKSCGAKYFVSMGVHHDNFDLWKSKHHRWNATRMGPRKDIVGLWKKAASSAGLRFGVSEHLERSFSWFGTNKGADSYGPYAGVPYDGNDPRYEDLYHPKHADTGLSYPANPTKEWVNNWFDRIKDLIDSYEPDLLYTDGGIPFGETGRKLMAHFYNANETWHDGRLEAVYNIKDMREHDLKHNRIHGDYEDGVAVRDIERGVVSDINPEPWQTDTCIGGWFYDSRMKYKTPQEIIHMLVDVVSKNGNLLLNIIQRPDGSLDEMADWTVRRVGDWMKVNGEALHATRPWKMFGEGPVKFASGHFAEKKADFTAEDFRFTRKGDILYAIVLAWPESGKIRIKSIPAGNDDGLKVCGVRMLGCSTGLKFKQDRAGLEVILPSRRPCEHAYSLRIEFK